MSRSDDRGVRPERRSAVAEDEVLAALVEHEWEEMNGVEIAARSRVPTATANRIITRMMSTGLLTHRYVGKERLVRIDVTSPLYRSTVERLWVRLGVEPSRLTSAQSGLRVPVQGGLASGGIPSRIEGVPPSLQAGVGAGSSPDVDPGPSAPVVRRLVLDLEALSDRCAQANDRLLDVATNGECRTGRDYELWRRSFGSAGVALAAGTLRRATARSPRDSNRRDDHALHAPEHVDGRTWTLATYAVAHEAARYRLQEKDLNRASRAGQAQYNARSDAQSAREVRARAATEDERRERDADQAAADARVDKIEGSLIKAYPLHGAWQHVGTSGERLLAAESGATAAEAERIAASMATEACVTRWQKENAEEAELYLLPRGEVDEAPAR